MADKRKRDPYAVDENALRERFGGSRGGYGSNTGEDLFTFGPVAANRRLVDPWQPRGGIYTKPDTVDGNPISDPDLSQPAAGTNGVPDAVVPNAGSTNGRPSYAGTYDDDLLALYDRISNRPDFEYDATKDPLYQQYKDQYMQGGKLAMRDTMGQAAALTGGYGTSYGQQVGQQAYDAYLQKLGEVVPELYGQAYGRYQDEGDKLLQQYAMLGQQRDTEYGRFRDELGDWERERNYQDQRESELYNRQYAEQQQAYAQLYALIGSTGYNPTDEELAAAGMTRAASDALRNEYTRQITPATTGGGGGGGRGGGYRSGSDIAELQRQLNAMGENLAVDGILGPLTQAAMARHGMTLNGGGGTGSGGGNAGYTLGELLSSSSSGYNAEQILDGLAAQGVPITDAVIEDVLWARGK